MDKLNWKKHNQATQNDVAAAVKIIKDCVKEHGWEDRVIFLYYKENIMDFLNKDCFINFDEYTYASKRSIIASLNSVIDQVNFWLERNV